MRGRTLLGRRPVLVGLLGAAALGAGRAAHANTRTARAALLAFAASLDCSPALARIARAALPPAESCRSFLVKALLAGLPASPHALTPAALARALSRASRTDFACGRLVVVEGWVLSRTEARLYALASFAPAPSV